MTDEERVRQLAYSIWEAEGRPEGQQQRHWDRALKIVAAEQAAGNDADDRSSSMEPFPEDSATVARTRRPRRSSDPLAASDATSTPTTASKTASKTAAAKQTAAKTVKKATPKAKKPKTPKPSDSDR